MTAARIAGSATVCKGEVNRNFRNDFRKNLCSIRFCTGISGNFGRIERAPQPRPQGLLLDDFQNGGFSPEGVGDEVSRPKPALSGFSPLERGRGEALGMRAPFCEFGFSHFEQGF